MCSNRLKPRKSVIPNLLISLMKMKQIQKYFFLKTKRIYLLSIKCFCLFLKLTRFEIEY